MPIWWMCLCFRESWVNLCSHAMGPCLFSGGGCHYLPYNLSSADIIRMSVKGSHFGGLQGFYFHPNQTIKGISTSIL